MSVIAFVLMTDHPSALVSVPDAIIAACKGEQEHFEGWAKSSRYDMSEHPLHYIFLDPKTDAARRGWNAALAYVRNNAAAPAAPQAAGVGEREAIARIMDPKGWETRDRQYDAIKRSTMHDKDRPLAFANADYYTRDSLTKADAILALRAPSREPEGGAAWSAAIEAAAKTVERQIPAAAGGPMSHTNTARVFMFDAVKAIRALATREEAPAEAGKVIVKTPCQHCLRTTTVTPESLALYRDHLRAQPQAREDAQPVSRLHPRDGGASGAGAGKGDLAMTPYAYTPETLAELWEVSPATIRNLVRGGGLKAFRIGRQIRIRPEAVSEYEDKQCQTGGSSSIEENTPPSGRSTGRRSGTRFAPPILQRPNAA